MLPACCAKRREVNNFLDSMETGRRIDSVGMATPGPDRVFLSMDDLLATAAPEIILAPNTRCCARFDVMRSSEFCAQKTNLQNMEGGRIYLPWERYTSTSWLLTDHPERMEAKGKVSGRRVNATGRPTLRIRRLCGSRIPGKPNEWSHDIMVHSHISDRKCCVFPAHLTAGWVDSGESTSVLGMRMFRVDSQGPTT